MTSPPSPPWRWLRIQLRPALGLLAGFLALGVWLGGTVALEMRTSGNPDPWTRPLLWELTGAVATWAVVWIPASVVLNAPRPGGNWRRFLGLHVAGWATYTTLKSTLMLAPRFALYPWLGWGPYRYGDWPAHLAMEAMKDVLAYALIALGFQTLRVWRERQDEQLRQARLEAELHDAQLRQLTGQLDPHFLFNALNTVSSVMYEDLGRTDALLTDLGQLLRAGLERRGPTWTLAEEGEHLERYDALLLARFQDRLRVEVDLSAAPPQARVPRFALQRLVENAVKHNQGRRELLSVSVRAREDQGRLELTVSDDGEGFQAPEQAFSGNGHGLRGLREALRLLHGDQAHLAVASRPGGGATVRLDFPLMVGS